MLGTAAGLIGQGLGQWFANRQTSAESDKNRDFQREMMSNRYQMQAKDMKAAGWNPLLNMSASAPMPAGGQASGFGNVGAGALQASLMREQLAQTKAQTSLLYNSANKVAAETKSISLSQPEQEAQSLIYDNKYGKYLKGAEKFLQHINPFKR